MRIVIASSFAVVLSTALVFLVSLPQETLSQDPLTIAKVAVSVLGPFVSSYLDDLRAKKEAETVKIRLWMHNADPKLNGCGFDFHVNGYAGGTGHGSFPDKVIHTCGTDQYEMRMSSQSAMYDKKVHLGNEQAKQIELHAGGWHDTYVNVLCIGLNERTIAGGPRAFCVNNDLLKGCKGLTNKWNDINLERSNMLFTNTSRGTHKIVFREIEKLARGFESLGRKPNNAKAVQTVCDQIDLIRGTDSDDNWLCPARKYWYESVGWGVYHVFKSRYTNENKNPFGCERYTDRR